MKTSRILNNQEGFTLVEIIAVLIILGILAAVAVPRYIDLETNAKSRAIDAAVSELNGRESLVWADQKIHSSGWISDTKTFNLMSKDLGEDYVWKQQAAPELANSEAKVNFKNAQTDVSIYRRQSALTHPASWKRTPWQ